MRKTRIAAAVLLAALVLLAPGVPPAARAQAPQLGHITGHVTDETGADLPGATVTLRADGVSRVIGTDEKGRFTFDQLSTALQYTVTAELPGFSTATHEGVIVAAAGSIEVALFLDPGCLRGGPPLTASVPPLEQLVTAELVAHIRVTEDAHDLDVRHGRSCSRYDAAPATILPIVAPARGAWRPGRESTYIRMRHYGPATNTSPSCGTATPPGTTSSTIRTSQST